MDKEEFLYCTECRIVTKWVLWDEMCGVRGECTECEHQEDFDDWEQALKEGVSD